MNIKKFKDHYKVESSHKGKFYEVWPNKPFCSCPDFKFRELRKRGVCKHIKTVEESITKKETQAELPRKTKPRKIDNTSKIIDFVRKKGEVDAVKLIEKYGSVVEELLAKGDLIEERGKIRVLE